MEQASCSLRAQPLASTPASGSVLGVPPREAPGAYVSARSLAGAPPPGLETAGPGSRQTRKPRATRRSHGRLPAAVGRAAAPGGKPPAAAAQDAVRGAALRFDDGIDWARPASPIGVWIPLVQAPLLDVSVHVMKLPIIGMQVLHGVCRTAGIANPPPGHVQGGFAVTGGILGGGTGPTGKLPVGLTRQTPSNVEISGRHLAPRLRRATWESLPRSTTWRTRSPPTR